MDLHKLTRKLGRRAGKQLNKLPISSEEALVHDRLRWQADWADPPREAAPLMHIIRDRIIERPVR